MNLYKNTKTYQNIIENMQKQSFSLENMVFIANNDFH